MSLAPVVHDLLGSDPPVRVVAYDGTDLGPRDAPATLVVRDVRAVHHLLRAPGELGIARAYVTGALDVVGDLFAVLDLGRVVPSLRLRPRTLLALVREVGVDPWRRPPPLPAEEIDPGPRWRRHRPERDRRSVRHHYDVGNEFYELLLGPSLTYSCAVFHHPDETLEDAQAHKHELVCRKLGLRPGQRLLDVGCGWGSLLLHAAARHGVHGVGVTLSEEQAALARRRVTRAGLDDRVEIRVQDYRDVVDGPFDAVSSIGMFEHVGAAQRAAYFTRLAALVRPGGRVLNHQIGRPSPPWSQRLPQPAAVASRGFINRYVFPDGELQEVHAVVQAMERSGLEVRHLESLREHYPLTLRRWVANLEDRWDEAVGLVGEARARVWRLYLAGSAVAFESGRTQVHQVLATATPTTGRAQGRSGMTLRPTFEGELVGRVEVDAPDPSLTARRPAPTSAVAQPR